MEQQLEASILGMWVFLVTEIMFFGGLFMAYIVYRTMYPEAWVDGSNQPQRAARRGQHGRPHLQPLTMVLAVRSAQVGSRTRPDRRLIRTILFGTTFLVVKYFEYASKFEHHLVPGPHFSIEYFEHLGRTGVDPHATQLFFSLYFIMTGIHAAHMVVGIVLMSVILWMAWRGRFTPDYYGPIESLRSLLALRRHRLDLPLSAAVPARSARRPRSLSTHMSHTAHTIVSVRIYVTIFVALMVLTGRHRARGATRTSASLNTTIALSIAVTKATLVVMFFMGVRYNTPLTKVTVIAGFFWLSSCSDSA